MPSQIFLQLFVRILKFVSITIIPIAMTGCSSCYLPGDEAKDSCRRVIQADSENREKNSQQNLPALQKRADAGDAKAQAALGNFHVFGYHPNSLRAVGIAYFEKAGKQGDLLSQRHFVFETYLDCKKNAYALGRNQGLTNEQFNASGPQYSPRCEAQWRAVEQLAAKTCVTQFPDNSNASYSLPFLVAETYDVVNRADEADFWYVVALNSCTSAAQRNTGNFSGFNVNPRSQRGSQELRGAMWFEVRGWKYFPGIVMPSPEMMEKAKQRMTMLQEKVARSGIHPQQ